MKLEKATQQQAENKLWHSERQWRLTASKFGEICKATDLRDVNLLCESIFNPPELNNFAVNHGKTYEPIAIKKFEELNNLKVEKCGIFVNPKFPYLGASPDGIIDDKTIIEVKCPYNGRNSNVLPGKFFPFLCYNENLEIVLKQNHNYYYQIMGQLAISKSNVCQFIVFTLKDVFVQKILFDNEFFENNMLPKLSDFFAKNYRPYIVSKL